MYALTKETFFIGQKETWLNPIWVSISINQHQSAIISIKQPKEKIFFMVSHVLYVSFRGISKRRRCMLNISFDCKHIWKNFDILNEGKPIRRKFNNRILTHSSNLLQNLFHPLQIFSECRGSEELAWEKAHPWVEHGSGVTNNISYVKRLDMAFCGPIWNRAQTLGLEQTGPRVSKGQKILHTSQD